MGDSTKVLDEFIFCHADAEVLNGEEAGIVVGGNVDFEFEVVVVDFLLD